MSGEGECVPVREEADIVAARQRGRLIAEKAGFRGSALTIIATVISELARNIVDYAHGGEVCIEVDSGDDGSVLVIARDRGPGIPDVESAMRDGYSTGGGLGLGLPGVRRLMDDFHIETSLEGTIVRARKKLRR